MFTDTWYTELSSAGVQEHRYRGYLVPRQFDFWQTVWGKTTYILNRQTDFRIIDILSFLTKIRASWQTYLIWMLDKKYFLEPWLQLIHLIPKKIGSTERVFNLVHWVKLHLPIYAPGTRYNGLHTNIFVTSKWQRKPKGAQKWTQKVIGNLRCFVKQKGLGFSFL